MIQDTHTFQLQAVGEVTSPYREKFAIPRQPGLVTAAKSSIRLNKRCNREEILRGLVGFSHIWVLFMFHKAMRDDWKPMVRPPRLGGNEKVGVFASRSPFRPNPIGISVVKLNDIVERQGQWYIEFEGGDLLSGTPVIDIKPYLPYVDAIPDASGGYAEQAPRHQLSIRFSPCAEGQINVYSARYPKLRTLIEQILAQQPQPAYRKTDTQTFGMSVYDLNIRWTQNQQAILVEDVSQSNQQQ